MPQFLFDNSIAPQVPEALALVDVLAHHVTDIEELGRDAPDQAIVAWCERESAVWVTADMKASKRSKVQAIPALGRICIAFFKPTSPGWTKRQWLLQTLRRADEMEKLYEENSPVWYRFTARGRPRPIPIPQP